MKDYATDAIRNVALVSHGGGGKTSLGEAFLFHTGAINRMGKVEEGNTISDFEDEEIRRKLSLSTTLLPLEYKDFKINLLDTPGYTDFIGEVISALRVADGAMVLVDSVSGGKRHRACGATVTRSDCRAVVISKMDRDNAFEGAPSRCALSPRCVSSRRPMGEKQKSRA
jgi:elongation factor G